MKQKALILLALVSILLFNNLVWAADPPIPAPSSLFYVLDQAKVLDAETEQLIVQTSAALEQRTKAQVVVVTVNSLEDYTPEDFALAILRNWEIGDAELDNGVLILVSPQERVARIEVGYGLEGALPDGKTGRIQDEYMIPYFQQGDYNQGIINGYLAIAREVAREYQVDLEPLAGPYDVYPEAGLSWLASLIIVIVLIALLFVDNRLLGGFFTGMFFGSLLGRGGRRNGGRRGGGGFGGGGFGGFRGGGGSGGGGGSTRRW